jgi:hypothetical protein
MFFDLSSCAAHRKEKRKHFLFNKGKRRKTITLQTLSLLKIQPVASNPRKTFDETNIEA